MPIIPFIEEKAGEMRAVFEDLHRHPEIGFEEQHASGVVAELLEKWGFDEVHTGIAKTGVVGILRGRNAGNRRVGLRADMDALPIDEISGVPYASQNPGRMHACGHDGHTTMLLGAAQYLAATRNFEGTAVCVFQPAEEGLGGARGMIAEGLFERFPCDEIYGMHNQPLGTLGKAVIRKGAAMAGASFFDIKLTGKGSHAAQPHNARDVLVIGADRSPESFSLRLVGTLCGCCRHYAGCPHDKWLTNRCQPVAATSHCSRSCGRDTNHRRAWWSWAHAGWGAYRLCRAHWHDICWHRHLRSTDRSGRSLAV